MVWVGIAIEEAEGGEVRELEETKGGVGVEKEVERGVFRAEAGRFRGEVLAFEGRFISLEGPMFENEEGKRGLELFSKEKNGGGNTNQAFEQKPSFSLILVVVAVAVLNGVVSGVVPVVHVVVQRKGYLRRCQALHLPH